MSQVACLASKPPDTTRSPPNGASQYTPPGPLCPSYTAPAAPVLASKVRIVPVLPPERMMVPPSFEYSGACGRPLDMIPVSGFTVHLAFRRAAAGSPAPGGTGGGGSGATTTGVPGFTGAGTDPSGAGGFVIATGGA